MEDMIKKKFLQLVVRQPARKIKVFTQLDVGIMLYWLARIFNSIHNTHRTAAWILNGLVYWTLPLHMQAAFSHFFFINYFQSYGWNSWKSDFPGLMKIIEYLSLSSTFAKSNINLTLQNLSHALFKYSNYIIILFISTQQSSCVINKLTGGSLISMRTLIAPSNKRK